MGKAHLVKNNIFENYHFWGVWAQTTIFGHWAFLGPKKNGFGHILVKNDHLIVIEGFLEAYWKGTFDKKNIFDFF